jgi:hypothetical protein
VKFVDDTLRPTLSKASDEAVERGLRRYNLRVRIAGYVTAVCFVAGVWVDWRFLPTMAIPAAAYVFNNLLRGAVRREADRREAE